MRQASKRPVEAAEEQTQWRTEVVDKRVAACPVMRCGFSRSAAIAGESVNDTVNEMAVEAAIVIANCLKNVPCNPVMKAVGRNTPMRTREIAINAVPTSSIVLWAASLGA